jgi:hypothetical protein
LQIPDFPKTPEDAEKLLALARHNRDQHSAQMNAAEYAVQERALRLREQYARKDAAQYAVQQSEFHLLQQRALDDAAYHALQQSLVELDLTQQELGKAKRALQNANQGVGSIRALIRGLGIPPQSFGVRVPSNGPGLARASNASLSESELDDDDRDGTQVEPELDSEPS